MARGDHLKVTRFGYTHHAIDCGDGTVIHFAGEDREKAQPVVRRARYADFARDGRVTVVRHRFALDPEEAAARAEMRLGEGRYHVIFNNCEHFASWCASGARRSRQAHRGLQVASGVVLTAGVLAAAGLRRVARRTRRRRAW
jgi:hypothetical protein